VVRTTIKYSVVVVNKRRTTMPISNWFDFIDSLFFDGKYPDNAFWIFRGMLYDLVMLGPKGVQVRS